MEEVNFINPEQETTLNRNKFDFEFIISKQIDLVRYLRSREMRGGYYEKHLNGNMVIEQYVPNERIKYISSVKSLKYMLVIYEDDKFTEKYKILMEKIEKELEKHKKVNTQESKEIYDDFLVEIYDELFQELLLLANRRGLIGNQDYLEEGIM